MCGNDLNGLHSLSPQHGTEHFSDLISFIITTALWDGDHYENHHFMEEEKETSRR